jgi:hypothetical protein
MCSPTSVEHVRLKTKIYKSMMFVYSAYIKIQNRFHCVALDVAIGNCGNIPVVFMIRVCDSVAALQYTGCTAYEKTTKELNTADALTSACSLVYNRHWIHCRPTSNPALDDVKKRIVLVFTGRSFGGH